MREKEFLAPVPGSVCQRRDRSLTKQNPKHTFLESERFKISTQCCVYLGLLKLRLYTGSPDSLPSNIKTWFNHLLNRWQNYHGIIYTDFIGNWKGQDPEILPITLEGTIYPHQKNVEEHSGDHDMQQKYTSLNFVSCKTCLRTCATYFLDSFTTTADWLRRNAPELNADGVKYSAFFPHSF